MKKKKFGFVRIVLFIIVLFVIGISSLAVLGKQKTMDLSINNIDLQTLPDGTYSGNYNAFRWTNSVNVSISDHKITDITVVKAQMAAKPEVIEQIKKEVISKQNLDIDIVAGATADTKAYLKAVENALKK